MSGAPTHQKCGHYYSQLSKPRIVKPVPSRYLKAAGIQRYANGSLNIIKVTDWPRDTVTATSFYLRICGGCRPEAKPLSSPVVFNISSRYRHVELNDSKDLLARRCCIFHPPCPEVDRRFGHTLFEFFPR